MEIVIGLVIIIVLLIALGVDTYYILLGVFLLMLLALAVTVIFFAATAFTLIGAQRRKVSFDRIDKAEGKRFNTAVYKDGEGEYRNAFPSEPLLKPLLYDKDRSTGIFVTKGGKAYDRYSIVTIIVGLTVGSASLALLGAWAISILKI
ncbi:MAG: hypothetical protein IKO44_03625 [Ruminococcus sp.]|nr:hypothetical protein [Ruminococcus sp.]